MTLLSLKSSKKTCFMVFIFPFLLMFAFLIYSVVMPSIFPLFEGVLKSISIFSLLFLMFSIVTAGLFAMGGSFFFIEIFCKKTRKPNLNLFTGIFSLISFYLVLAKLPNNFAIKVALITIPITNFLILLSISTWMYLERSFSKRLILSLCAVTFFFNHIYLMGFVNRFNYFERGWGWNMLASAIVLDLIFIVTNYFFISRFLEKKRSKKNEKSN